MKHLTSWSVFERFEDIPGEGDLQSRLSAMGIEGLELFTLFEPVDLAYYNVPSVTSVHLPYAIDWHSAWEGRDYGETGTDRCYFSFGSDREGMVESLRLAIDSAAPLDPAYGVLHAGNTDIRQVRLRKHADDGGRVLRDFAELMNCTVSAYPKGEPPFRLAFENLWWEGLKLLSSSEWRILEDNLEFDNWGFTLDTGHMMNTIDSAFDEDSAVDGLLRIIGQYPKDMIDRIGTVHLQCSASAQYRTTFEEASFDPGCDMKAWCEAAYHHAGRIDQHRPFTSKRALEIVDILRPDYLTHELYGSASGDRWKDVIGQRSLFKS